MKKSESITYNNSYCSCNKNKTLQLVWRSITAYYQ